MYEIITQRERELRSFSVCKFLSLRKKKNSYSSFIIYCSVIYYDFSCATRLRKGIIGKVFSNNSNYAPIVELL